MDTNKNNGSLWLSVRDAADRLGLGSVNSARKAFDELQLAGFVTLTQDSRFWTQDARFKVKASDTSRARCWKLNHLPVPSQAGATNEWRDYQPDKLSHPEAHRRCQRGQKAHASYRKALSKNRLPVSYFDTLPPISPQIEAKPVSYFDTAKCQNDAKLPKVTVSKNDTHTAVTMGCGEQAQSLISWWQPDQSRTLANLTYLRLLAIEAQQPERLAA